MTMNHESESVEGGGLRKTQTKRSLISRCPGEQDDNFGRVFVTFESWILELYSWFFMFLAVLFQKGTHTHNSWLMTHDCGYPDLFMIHIHYYEITCIMNQSISRPRSHPPPSQSWVAQGWLPRTPAPRGWLDGAILHHPGWFRGWLLGRNFHFVTIWLQSWVLMCCSHECTFAPPTWLVAQQQPGRGTSWPFDIRWNQDTLMVPTAKPGQRTRGCAVHPRKPWGQPGTSPGCGEEPGSNHTAWLRGT